jgi:AcrR family transcriptional regulator
MRAPERRLQLLDVTTRLAVDEGFHAVTVEAVARRAGITRAVIYQQFGDLHTLLEEAVRRETTRALTQITATAMTTLAGDNAKERMLDSLSGYLCAVRDHPTTWRLVLMPPEGAPKSLRETIADGRRAVLEHLTRAVRPSLLSGDIFDAELTARVLSAIADQYALLVLTDPLRYSPERLLLHADWWLDKPAFGL